MYNREKTEADFPQEKPIKIGSDVAAEGMLLAGELDASGKEVVFPSAGSSAEKIAGFSTMTNLRPDQETKVAKFAIPSSAPYEVSLGETNLVAGQIRIDAETTGALTETAGVPASGEFRATDATGLLEFHADEAGQSITVYYKHQLTVAEAKQRYFEGFINNNDAFSNFNVTGVLSGKGVIYTDQFDISKDYAASGTLKSAAGGLVTLDGAGAPLSAKVIEVPSLSNPFLGLEFLI